MKLLKTAAFFLLIGTCLSNSTKKENQPKDEVTTTKTVTTEKTPNARANDIAANNTVPNDAENEISDEGWEYENKTLEDTRRILYSKKVGLGKKPYMVYLSLTKESAKAHKYRGWLCGGVIVDSSYVLTSAACVEDADKFYIVSGTNKFVDSFDIKEDECVCKRRRKAVWKCIPKNYKFDFQDSIKWSSNDIAIVKVNKPFKLGEVEQGCQYAAATINYNNISRELEKPGTKGWIAGWGSGNTFREGVYRRQDKADGTRKPENAKCLQEAKVCIMDNGACAKKWAQRFRSIITQYMICTKDVMRRISEVCNKKYANCTDLDDSRRVLDEEFPDAASTSFNVDLGRHLKDPEDYTARRSAMQGGFCENDHGGPLLVKYKSKETVIGVISACKIDPKSHSCHGPFLYTSIFRNRQFISCAIHKDVEDNCRRVFRTGITHEEYTVDWSGYKEDDDEKTDEESVGEKKESESNVSSDSEENKEEGEAKKVTQDKKKKEKRKKSKTAKHEDNNDYRRNGDKEVFYESSKDENVNDPEDFE